MTRGLLELQPLHLRKRLEHLRDLPPSSGRPSRKGLRLLRHSISRAFVPPCVHRYRRWMASLGPAALFRTGTLDAHLIFSGKSHRFPEQAQAAASQPSPGSTITECATTIAALRNHPVRDRKDDRSCGTWPDALQSQMFRRWALPAPPPARSSIGSYQRTGRQCRNFLGYHQASWFIAFLPAYVCFSWPRESVLRVRSLHLFPPPITAGEIGQPALVPLGRCTRFLQPLLADAPRLGMLLEMGLDIGIIFRRDRRGASASSPTAPPSRARRGAIRSAVPRRSPYRPRYSYDGERQEIGPALSYSIV